MNALASRHPSPPSTRPRLAELLDAELEYSSEARGGFVNHLGMSLVAAAGLGATDAELIAHFEAEVRGDFLRTRERPDWLDPLRTEVEQRGTRAVLLDKLPALLASMDARWFHSVIRLEHAVDAHHPAQIANALGDWASVARPLPELPTQSGSKSLVEVARAFSAKYGAPDFGRQRLHAVAEDPRVPEAFAEARLGAHAVGDALELALHAHVAGNNFTTLHLVTGSAAAAALAPHLPGDLARTLGARIAQAVFAGYLSGGSGQLPTPLALDELRSRILPEWSTLATGALATGDAHVIKLAYACQRLEALTEDRLYRWVAARATR